MIVVVDDGVFASQSGNSLGLASLLRLGFEGRHLVQTAPPWDPEQPLAVNRWLAEQATSLREQAELALRSGLEKAVHFPPALTVRVPEDPARRREADLRFSLERALQILERPLHVLLEDLEHDGAFLRAVAHGPWRVELERAITAAWIELEHGGGIPRMKPRLEQRTPTDLLRLWVLFDSDARAPGRPSAESEALRKHCEYHSIAHHQLHRRAAENYLPLPALAAWSHVGPRNRRKERQATYLAFKQLGHEQRHHFNMRRGFAADENDPNTRIPAIFDAWVHRPELRNGFGPTIRGLFKQKDFQIREEWLHRDGQQPETAAIIRSILRHL